MYHWKSERLCDVFCGMKQRCYNPNIHSYKTYGGKGITICDEWLKNPGEFEKWAFENSYDKNAAYGQCTIDRIDSTGNYEPSNCRWITQKEQANNTRRNRFITHNGETHTLTEWAEKYNIDPSVLNSRLTRDKMDFEKAIQNINLCRRKVNMYLPKSHKLVNSFDSLSEASAYIKGHTKCVRTISEVCRGKRKTAYGFYWQYAD